MIFKIGLFLLCALVPFVSFAQNSEQEAILKTFETYRKSLLDGNAEKAFECVDENTRNYYEEILDHVLYLSAEKSKRLMLMDKLILVLCRHRVPKEELVELDGESFFKYAVNKGWIGKEGVRKLQIGQIQINGNLATTKIRQGAQFAPFGFAFQKEKKGWKIDLTSIHMVTMQALLYQIQQMKLTEEEFLFRSAEQLSRMKVDREKIWEPLFRERPKKKKEEKESK